MLLLTEGTDNISTHGEGHESGKLGLQKEIGRGRFRASVPNSPVNPSSGEDGTDYGLSPAFLGVLGRTTAGKVRTGRTIGDYGPSAWASCTSQAESYTSKPILFTS